MPEPNRRFEVAMDSEQERLERVGLLGALSRVGVIHKRKNETRTWDELFA